MFAGGGEGGVEEAQEGVGVGGVRRLTFWHTRA